MGYSHTIPGQNARGNFRAILTGPAAHNQNVRSLMKKSFLPLLLALVVTVGTVGRVRADTIPDTPENRREQAARYLAATPPKEMMTEMLKSITGSMPAAQRDRMTQMFATGLDMDALTKAMNDSLVKTFTAEELKALADFYSSPIGKSAMSKMTVYMADLMPTVQAQMLKAFQNSAQPTPNH